MTPRLFTRRLPTRCLLVVLVATLLGSFLSTTTGCQHHPRLARVPSLLVDVNPAAVFRPLDDPGADHRRYSVFIASDRRYLGGASPGRIFSEERAMALTLAQATLRLGRDYESWSDAVAASTDGNQPEHPTFRITDLQAYGTLSRTVPPREFAIDPNYFAVAPDPEDTSADRAFADDLTTQLTDAGEVYVYVHGYNTRFEHNAAFAASLRHYLGRRGPAIVYAWPSRGKLFGYFEDKGNAEFSVRHFRELMVYLASLDGVKRIHVVAHSAGCPIVVNALTELRLRHEARHIPAFTNAYFRARTRIGRVVLAAPDMDLMAFIQSGRDGFSDLPESLCIYISAQDNALFLSSELFGQPRLGRDLLNLTQQQRNRLLSAGRSHAVDALGAQAHFPSLLGHSYYHQNPWVFSDLLVFLATGLEPADRGLTSERADRIYTFPTDYEERLPALREAYTTGLDD